MRIRDTFNLIICYIRKIIKDFLVKEIVNLSGNIVMTVCNYTYRYIHAYIQKL